ncbi:tetratricopeptide repeat protein [Patescibacteria group bacterium]|nr:tetratricopeptide repeat protein [Patescibacteria group bacterium]MBU2259101.1 tetratricopeptide repeat protein [Patescibacteria group bacterium]
MIRALRHRKILSSILIGAVFLIAVFLAFGHSLTQGFAPVDDIFLIVENLAIRGVTWENLMHVFTTYDPELYVPLVFVSFQLNWLLGGLEPFGYHLTNILLHVINALLVARILFQLSGKKWLSIFAGLLFAVHPLHTEAVVWLAGRKDLLSGTFFFAALTCYLSSVKGSRCAYILSVIFFALALLSKVIAVTLFGVIILHLLLIEKRRFTKPVIVNLLPYALLSVVFMIVAMGGKGRVVAAVSSWDKVLVACKSTIFYLQKLLVPTDLTIIYPLQGDISLWSEDILPYAILSTLLVVVALRSWRRHPWLTFGIGWYLATLAPTYLNIGKAGLVFFAVDRYAYLPSVAVLFILVMLLSRIVIPKKVAVMIGIAALFSCVSLSIKQTRFWDTPDGLFQRTLEIYPESIGARVGLSTIYRHQNKLEEAFEVLREGLKYGEHSLLELYVGYVYAKAGQVSDAKDRFLSASQMDPINPEPLFALGSLYEKTGEPGRAIPLYEQAIALDDSYVIVRARLGLLYLDEGREEEAREQFEAALKWNINSYEANLGMVELLKKEQKTQEALKYQEKVDKLTMDN